VVSGDAPHTPGGCPFQAWSLAALLRLERIAPTVLDANLETLRP
jgi:glycogen debranching enzyme